MPPVMHIQKVHSFTDHELFAFTEMSDSRHQTSLVSMKQMITSHRAKRAKLSSHSTTSYLSNPHNKLTNMPH